MSMIKLRAGGKSRYWDDNPRILHLDGGSRGGDDSASTSSTVAVLTLPPAITARMAVTIDSISKGRFGVNLVTEAAEGEYDQMGLWPGEEHFKHRYEMVTEYVTVMKELWRPAARTSRATLAFKMNDCGSRRCRRGRSS